MGSILGYIQQLFGWLPTSLALVFGFVISLFVFIVILKVIKLIVDIIPFV